MTDNTIGAIVGAISAIVLAIVRAYQSAPTNHKDPKVPDVNPNGPAPVLAGEGPMVSRRMKWSQVDKHNEANDEQRENLRRITAIADTIMDETGYTLTPTPHGGFHGATFDRTWRKRGKGSRHRKGSALDLRPNGIGPMQMVSLIAGLMADGTIPKVTAVAYPKDGFLHMDLEPGRTWKGE